MQKNIWDGIGVEYSCVFKIYVILNFTGDNVLLSTHGSADCRATPFSSTLGVSLIKIELLLCSSVSKCIGCLWMKRINLASHVKNALPDVTTPFAKNSVHLSPWTHIYIFNLQLDNEARFERVRAARRCSPLGLALKAHNARLFQIIRSWQGGVGWGVVSVRANIWGFYHQI